jgi:hypothetical protein
VIFIGRFKQLIPKEVRFWTFQKWRGRPACERNPFNGRRDARPTIKQPRVEFLRALGITHCYVCFNGIFPMHKSPVQIQANPEEAATVHLDSTQTNQGILDIAGFRETFS